MSEFSIGEENASPPPQVSGPAPSVPLPPSPQPASAPKASLLTRPLFLGQSLPWLAGGVLVIGFAAWYLFWPTGGTSRAEVSGRAFEGAAGFSAVQGDSSAPIASAPLQTGGLSVPTASQSPVPAGGSVPDEVVKRIVDSEAFGAANREAITRLSDTVRAQSVALASLQKQLETLANDNKQLFNRVTILEARQPVATAGQGGRPKTASRSGLSGMRLESLQDGMAWVSWQGRTWALQPGDRLGPVTVQAVNAAERSVTTSAGVLR